jgi:hypothetical protein
MSDNKKGTQTVKKDTSGRRGFLYTVMGGVLAALTGCIAGAPPKEERPVDEEPTAGLSEARLSALEAKVAQLEQQLGAASSTQPLAQLEGEMNERVVFNKSELTITNPEGVLLNLVATNGHVGIRFYKDFGFGDEQVNSPWHMGFIEGIEGYQGLAILRDWRFTAALWDEDGKLLLGRLHPHPPANDPAKARLHVRGTLDEVQAIVEGSANQAADIFQVLGGEGTKHLAVNSAGQVVVGSQDDPKGLILHDTQDKSAYSLKVTNGQLTLTRV